MMPAVGVFAALRRMEAEREMEYLEFLGSRTPLTIEAYAALRKLKDQAKPFVFKPVVKSHYCKSEGRLGCDCLPCVCPEDFLEKQKHLSPAARFVNRSRAVLADWLELAARRVR